jgi:hypothetical protein
MILVSGSIFALSFLVLTFIMYLFCVNRSIKGKPPTLRTLPGLTAIEECIKRAIEMGRPVFYSTGVGDITGGDMSMTLAGLTLLGYAARLSADIGASFTYIACARPAIVPIAEDLLRTAYGENYKPEQINFIPNQTALMSSIIGEYERSKPAANFLLGALYWETVILAEAGANIGAMQVGGTGRLYQVPYCVALCDYSLIAEELLAAGAYISQDPSQLGSILGSDILRVIIIALAIIVAITGASGYDITGLFNL